jgi:hypothetical protein
VEEVVEEVPLLTVLTPVLVALEALESVLLSLTNNRTCLIL